MRVFFVLVLLAGGCGDDTTSGAGDLGASGDDLSLAGADVGGGDLPCANRAFGGFSGTPTSLAYFACPCGCTLDAMESSGVNPMWGATHTASSSFAPIAGVGLGEDLHYSGSVEQLGLYSVAPTAQFFLDGDFDMLIDYDLVTSPPGESHLVLSVRDPGAVQNIQIYEIERAQLADGSNGYATMLGGVPAKSVATTATRGTLRITRQGYTYTTYGDATQVSTLIAQQAPRVAVNVTATLNGCTTSDEGASCGYQPRFHNLRLASGTLVNQP
jgi:hypothetical protein